MGQDEEGAAAGASASFVSGGASGQSGAVPCVIGTGTLGIRAALEDAVGPVALERVLASLDDDERTQYAAVTPTSWVPLDLSTKIIDAVARETGRDVDAFFAEMVRAGTLRALTSFHRALLRFAWDEMLVARAAGAYGRIRNVGRLEATLVRPGNAIALLREWPRLTERHARSLGYTMEAFFLAAGKHGVRVDTTLDAPRRGELPDGATYRCSWRS